MVALGIQYQVTDALSVRVGYTGNQNPIPAAMTSFNIASPAVIQNNIAVGASYQLTHSLTLSLAYAHGFANSISGPLVSPFGPLPFYSVQTSASYDSLLFGASVQF
jgi:long-chain fatty acid transport protein